MAHAHLPFLFIFTPLWSTFICSQESTLISTRVEFLFRFIHFIQGMTRFKSALCRITQLHYHALVKSIYHIYAHVFHLHFSSSQHRNFNETVQTHIHRSYLKCTWVRVIRNDRNCDQENSSHHIAAYHRLRVEKSPLPVSVICRLLLLSKSSF